MLLRIEDVCNLLGVSRTTLWRWRREGMFPQPRRVGPNVVGFLESEVDEWLQDRPVVGEGNEAA